MVNSEAQHQIAAMTGDQRIAARKDLDKTQMDIAVECGVSIGTVRNWESGSKPLKSHAPKYAAALGLDG